MDSMSGGGHSTGIILAMKQNTVEPLLSEYSIIQRQTNTPNSI